MEELKHLNRKGKCNACEKMYRFTIEHLERQNNLLLEMLRDKHLSEPILMQVTEGSIITVCGVHSDPDCKECYGLTMLNKRDEQ